MPAVIHVGEQSKDIHGCDLRFGAYAICESGTSEANSNVTTLSAGNTSLVTNLVFYKTFMPPQHLIAYPHQWRGTYMFMQIWFVVQFDLSNDTPSL